MLFIKVVNELNYTVILTVYISVCLAYKVFGMDNKLLINDIKLLISVFSWQLISIRGYVRNFQILKNIFMIMLKKNITFYKKVLSFNKNSLKNSLMYIYILL